MKNKEMEIKKVASVADLKKIINSPLLKDDDEIGISIDKNDNNIYFRSSKDDDINNICDDHVEDDKIHHNKNDIVLHDDYDSNTNYMGLIKRVPYHFDNITNDQNILLNDIINDNRNINDKTSEALLKARRESNEIKRKIIVEAIDKILDIDDMVNKSIIDTIFEKEIYSTLDDKVNMINIINKE